MAFFDLDGAAPLRGYRPRRSKRTLGDPGTVPPGLLNGSGNSGGFAAAKINRLTLDFLARSVSADQDLYGDNRLLRARARKLALDNPFIRKFLAMVHQNVVGPAGILMQAKVTNQYGTSTADTKRINLRIEQEWNRWCRVGRCTADGRFSFAELQGMAIKNCAREGENLIKFVYGRQFNDTGIALQPLDNDQLDDTMMQQIEGGEIRMGVEVDPYRRPQAYWLFDGHPADIVTKARERKRIGAADIVHTAIWERPGQTRGYTWACASIAPLNMYGGYTEAELVAARASAAKFLVIEERLAEGVFSGDDEDSDGDGTNADGTQMMSANAGEALVLDPGQTANFIDPKHPTQAFRDFTRTTIRNIASGLLVSYPSLANDLEGVNFSSIRAGLLDERDAWRILQRWFIDHFLWPIFTQWLKMALLTTLSDIAPLTPAQMEQMVWRARGWEWVDPVKDADAAILRLSNGLSTYSRELANLGLDFEEIIEERAEEQKKIAALKLLFGTDLSGDQGGKGVAAGDESAAAEVDGGGKGSSKGSVKDT